MEQKIVEKSATRYIYRIKEANTEFFISIPANNQIKLTLVFTENITEEKIINYPSFQGKALIIPILGNKALEGLITNTEEVYAKMDQYLSFLINTAYKILTYNKIKIENQILLNANPKYQQFISWFITKYQGRIILTDLELESKPIMSASSKDPITGPTFQNTESPKIPESPIENVNIEEEPLIPNTKEPQLDTKEPGFVSYVLLGVLVAVISLVFLYLIL